MNIYNQGNCYTRIPNLVGTPDSLVLEKSSPKTGGSTVRVFVTPCARTDSLTYLVLSGHD